MKRQRSTHEKWSAHSKYGNKGSNIEYINEFSDINHIDVPLL